MKREKLILGTFCLLLPCFISGTVYAQQINNNNSIQGNRNNSIQGNHNTIVPGDNNTICNYCTIQNPVTSYSPQQKPRPNSVFTIKKEPVYSNSLLSEEEPIQPTTFPNSSQFKIKRQ
nr:hypothetical protein [Nostoc sp. ChiSLP01]